MADTAHNENKRRWTKGEQKTRVSIFLPRDLHRKLKARAVEQNATLTLLIENLLRKSA